MMNIINMYYVGRQHRSLTQRSLFLRSTFVHFLVHSEMFQKYGSDSADL